MMRRRWLSAWCCLSMAAIAATAPAWAGPEEAQLKAAFIYRFAQLTQWPPAPGPAREFTYCVAGSVALQDALRALTQANPGAAPVRLQYLSEPQHAPQCQLLVLGMKGRAELQRWREVLGDDPVLTVGDSAESFRSGAVIGLVLEPNGLAFRINQTEAKRRGLTLSYQLLKLAREVK